jgi:hypothetical protein
MSGPHKAKTDCFLYEMGLSLVDSNVILSQKSIE